ncbi:Protein tyrosine phosphatase domain-containing protein 1 [Thoreauomyces humboldtii]|nr:Protein tyrosine phosphatase domain-containing protein 1 [Thoreauomyces humboldtii]
MQRPSTRLIQEYALTDKFRELGVGSIFNLEEFGEHASCGDGIEASSGFSYLPETWMDAGVFYYNFGWIWYDEHYIQPAHATANLPAIQNVPDFSHMLSIAQVMAYALEDGSKAIDLVRTQRPLSVQTRKQALFVQQFEEYIKPFKVYFPGICARGTTEYSSVELLDLDSILQNQRRFFHGTEQRDLRYVPKIVAVIVARLNALAQIQTGDAGNAFAAQVIAGFAEFGGVAPMPESWINLQGEINAGHWTAISLQDDVLTLVNLLLYWVITLQIPLITDEQLGALRSRATPAARLQGLERGVLYTVNVILDALRKAGSPCPNSLRTGAIKTLARLLTSHRTTITHPYVPHLIYGKDVVPPLPNQWKGWGVREGHSRATSNAPPPPLPPRPTTDNTDELEAFLLFLCTECACGCDGRPVSVHTGANATGSMHSASETPLALLDDLLPRTPDEELTLSRMMQHRASMTSVASLAQQRVGRSTEALPAPLTSTQSSSYWAKVLVFIDLLDTDFAEDEMKDLRRMCMLRCDALEIAYEAYGDAASASASDGHERRYQKFIRAAKDLVGQIP